MAKWKEPRIEISGYSLTQGQAMAVRVAVEQFLMELAEDDFRSELGPIGDAYRERLQEVRSRHIVLAVPKWYAVLGRYECHPSR